MGLQHCVIHGIDTVDGAFEIRVGRPSKPASARSVEPGRVPSAREASGGVISSTPPAEVTSSSESTSTATAAMIR